MEDLSLRHPGGVEALLSHASRGAALQVAPDDDLLLAAIVRNSHPIHPGADERLAAVEFAEYVLHARTVAGKERIIREALRWVSLESFVSALCELASSEDASWAVLVENGAQILNEIIDVAATRRVVWATDEQALIGLLKECHDTKLIQKMSAHHSPLVSDAATQRLIALQ